MAWGGFYGWRPYVPVSKRRHDAAKKMKALAKKGHVVEPVQIEGRTIASTFWGAAWCTNLESYSDFENRLPRGRTYVRNGSVVDLKVSEGLVKAFVSGSELYTVEVKFADLAKARWKQVKESCAGSIDSVVDLLQGKLSDGAMRVLTSKATGLFPAPREITMKCSCPDWATMCKHVAAVMYGVGARLDTKPELLFVLRGVDHLELIGEAAQAVAQVGAPADGKGLGEGELSEIFGIEIDPAEPAETAKGPALPAPRGRAAKRREISKGPGRRGKASGRGRRSLVPVAVPVAVNEAQPNALPALGALSTRLDLLGVYLENEGDLSRGEYAVLFRVTPAQAGLELKRLTVFGVLSRKGQARGTRYIKGARLG